MKEIENFFNSLGKTLPTITLIDVIDILLVALLIYSVINLIRTTSAARIAKAIIIVILITFLTEILNLHTANYVMSNVLEIGIVALVIVFQPELRRMLEKLGGRSFKELVGRGTVAADAEDMIKQTVEACRIMSQERVGALIVMERDNSLEQICKSGTTVDAVVSQELIRNIFFPKASLHDGAIVISGDRILSAGCVLPLSENRQLSTDLGTRHRAGVGMSEISDALVIIVSEETGTISVADGGMLKRHLAAETLEKMLRNEFAENEQNKGLFSKIRNYRKGGNNDAET